MMHGILQYAALFAVDQEAHRVWGRFDHGKTTFGAAHLLTIIGVAALLILVAMIWRIFARRSAKTYTTASSPRLFRELCAAHGLKRSSRRLLQQLATTRGLANADTLFVEPQHFETKNLPHDLKAAAMELRELQQTLFG